MMALRYTVETSYNKDLIESTVSRVDIQGHTEKVFQSIARLQDQGVQDALIALGWTPPHTTEYSTLLSEVQAKEIVYLRARVAELEEEYKRLELNWLDQVERANK